MAHEPKKKHSKAAKRVRRAAIKFEPTSLIICSNCGAKKKPHMVCQDCGYYSGKQTNKGKLAVTVTKA